MINTRYFKCTVWLEGEGSASKRTFIFNVHEDKYDKPQDIEDHAFEAVLKHVNWEYTELNTED
jgi:hypothetical protein